MYHFIADSPGLADLREDIASSLSEDVTEILSSEFLNGLDDSTVKNYLYDVAYSGLWETIDSSLAEKYLKDKILSPEDYVEVDEEVMLIQYAVCYDGILSFCSGNEKKALDHFSKEVNWEALYTHVSNPWDYMAMTYIKPLRHIPTGVEGESLQTLVGKLIDGACANIERLWP